MSRIAMEAHVTGRVQGVAFRAWTRAEAEARGLSGWVRNESDGSVRAHLSGPAPAVAEMVRLLHDGPPAARVTDVQSKQTDPEPEIRGFRITH